jgi:uncharacterized coiled-coil protein SlyX
MKTMKEFEKRIVALEHELAFQSIALRSKLDQEYDRFVYLGSEQAKEQAKKQWLQAKQERFNRELSRLKAQLEIKFFGPRGIEGVRKLLPKKKRFVSFL